MDADSLLESLGLKYEELSAAERETYNQWIKELSQATLTVEKIHDFVRSLRDNIETELATHETEGKKDIYLKARLRNIMLLDAMLSAPELARKRLKAMGGQ